MKLTHVIPAIADEASGPSYSVTRLCQSLIDSGESVTLASLEWAHMAAKPAYLKTFQLGMGPRRLGRSPEMKRWLVDSCTRGDVDLLHMHSMWMMPNVYPGQAAMSCSVPLVVSPRGTLSNWALRNGSFTKSIFWPFIQKPALQAMTCVHATADSEYEEIRRMGFRQPVAVIPNGVDIPKLPLDPAKSTTRTLLFLGRIHAKKGLDMLLPAWRAVQDRFPEWCLRIVGPDNDGHLQAMKRMAIELSVERVEFSGALLGAEKWSAFAKAEVFVLPTYSENFGMAVAEALAAGKPAIVTKGAPWQGLITEGAGWWIDIGIDPLVACLEEVLSQSPIELATMGGRGRLWMGEKYSWQHVAMQMSETYRWILHGGSRPAYVIEN
jgi:glycosyltransferase involved in cell wall biosynthesis